MPETARHGIGRQFRNLVVGCSECIGAIRQKLTPHLFRSAKFR
jgi:hypothetical protein